MPDAAEMSFLCVACDLLSGWCGVQGLLSFSLVLLALAPGSC